MHKSIERDLITCAEAAEILGISKAAVYAGLRKGIVRYELRHGRMMVDPHRLVQRWRGVSDQEAWAQRCNAYLDCSAWGAPPWSHDQWATLRVVLELVEVRPQSSHKS